MLQFNWIFSSVSLPFPSFSLILQRKLYICNGNKNEDETEKDEKDRHRFGSRLGGARGAGTVWCQQLYAQLFAQLSEGGENDG